MLGGRKISIWDQKMFKNIFKVSSQNNDLLYNTHQKHQNTFDCLEMFGNYQKIKNIIFWICYTYKFHNSYFGFVVILGIFEYFVYLIYCWGPHRLTSFKNGRCGVPLHSPVGAEIAFQIYQFCHKVKQIMHVFQHGRAPLFSRNHMICCAVGPTTLLKDLLISICWVYFQISSAFVVLCFIHVFITCLIKHRTIYK